eukprot:Clim_evm110s134 gene=Clim_evmTU110s134
MSVRLYLGLFCAAIATLIGYIIDDLRHIDPNISTVVTCRRFPGLCTVDPPISLEESPGSGILQRIMGTHKIGRARRPIMDITMYSETGGWRKKLWRFAKLKHWNYCSITTEEYFVGMAWVNFNYLGDVFVYVVPLKEDSQMGYLKKYEYTGRVPLARGISSAPSSGAGCTIWQSGTDEKAQNYAYMSHCHNQTLYSDQGGWDISLSVPLAQPDENPQDSGPIRLDLSAQVRQEEGLVLMYPVLGSQWSPAYVHKAAGMTTGGTMSLTGVPKYWFKKSTSAMDWTKAHAGYDTRWRWASGNFFGVAVEVASPKIDKSRQEVYNVGINFSSLVYDIVAPTEQDGSHYNDKAVSAENAVWVDQKMIPLRRQLDFILPENAERRAKDPWQLRTTHPDPNIEAIDLNFHPHGLREDHIDAIVLKSDFVQPYGYFEGKITVTDARNGITYTITVDQRFGVVEDHWARW